MEVGILYTDGAVVGDHLAILTILVARLAFIGIAGEVSEGTGADAAVLVELKRRKATQTVSRLGTRTRITGSRT